MSAAIERLYARGKWGTGLSLYRNRWLHQRLPCADWLGRQNAIKITGSNGKGSVAQFTSAILSTLGHKTGCFTSPHLFHITERVQVDGVPVSSEGLDAALAPVLDLVDHYETENPAETFGTFEILTAAAMVAFEQSGCEALVIEAGVGGRLDVTRLIPGTVTALTSVDLEHQEILGPTREHILYDKADLCPPGGTLVCGLLSGDLEDRLAAYTALTGVTPLFVREACAAVPSADDGVWDFPLSGCPVNEVHLKALGSHQVTNAAIAICLTNSWLGGSASIDAAVFQQACRDALADAQPPLRLERLADDPPVIADVCHSPDAATKAIEAIRHAYPAAPVVLVTGASRNKDVEGILTALAPRAAHIVCTQATTMGRPAKDVARHLPQTISASHEAIDDLAHALAHAQTIARERRGLVLLAGGLFLAAEGAALLRGQNPETLRFL